MDIQHTAGPEAGKDYPRNWNEFLAGPRASYAQAAARLPNPTDPAALG
jgi:hypothetical protein